MSRPSQHSHSRQDWEKRSRVFQLGSKHEIFWMNVMTETIHDHSCTHFRIRVLSNRLVSYSRIRSCGASTRHGPHLPSIIISQSETVVIHGDHDDSDVDITDADQAGLLGESWRDGTILTNLRTTV